MSVVKFIDAVEQAIQQGRVPVRHVYEFGRDTLGFWGAKEWLMEAGIKFTERDVRELIPYSEGDYWLIRNITIKLDNLRAIEDLLVAEERFEEERASELWKQRRIEALDILYTNRFRGWFRMKPLPIPDYPQDAEVRSGVQQRYRLATERLLNTPVELMGR